MALSAKLAAYNDTSLSKPKRKKALQDFRAKQGLAGGSLEGLSLDERSDAMQRAAMRKKANDFLVMATPQDAARVKTRVKRRWRVDQRSI